MPTGGTGRAGFFEIATATNNEAAVYATTIGGGSAGYFTIDNPDSTNAAIRVIRNSNGFGTAITAEAYGNAHGVNVYGLTSGNTVQAQNDGGGRAGSFHSNTGSAVYGSSSNGLAGEFTITNPSNTRAALQVTTAGLAFAGFFDNTNQNNSVSTLFVRTNGIGGAGVFQINNTNNDDHAINASTNGSGDVLRATSSGAGSAGIFVIANSASSAATLYAYTQGKGPAGVFTISSASNHATALSCKTNGDGLAFDAQGTARVEVLEIVGGADLSESFDISSPLGSVEPGMVVCIDPANPGKLTISTEAYVTKVAGIVSGAGGVQAGMIMGQTGTIASDAHPVALTGRVYVWADVSNGANLPGDLHTTSSHPGHAMKVHDHSRVTGSILGKAMTSLEEGTGLVLVLVAMQ